MGDKVELVRKLVVMEGSPDGLFAEEGAFSEAADAEQRHI
jgi:hypothetical protein